MKHAETSEPAETESSSLGFEDRYAGLCILGVLEIIGGVAAALLVPAMLFFRLSSSAPRSRETEWNTRWLAVMCTWLALIAIGLIVLGIGAMRPARWAWALNLILSWFAVAVSLLLGVPTLGHILVTTESTGAAVAAAFVFVLVVAVPLLFLLFYRDKDVELTCKHRDPIERWTDRRPLPVLAAAFFCLWGACAALSNIGLPSSASDGLLGGAILLALVPADIYAAVAMFKLRFSGWCVAIGVEITHAIQAFLRLSQNTHAGALPPKPGSTWGTSSGWAMAIMSTAANIAFLLWVRGHFQRGGPGQVPEAPSESSRPTRCPR